MVSCSRVSSKKGKETKLCYAASVLMENRSGLLVDAQVSHATGRAEVETGLAMLERQCPTARRRTVGADKLYDTREFVAGCRDFWKACCTGRVRAIPPRSLAWRRCS